MGWRLCQDGSAQGYGPQELQPVEQAVHVGRIVAHRELAQPMIQRAEPSGDTRETRRQSCLGLHPIDKDRRFALSPKWPRVPLPWDLAKEKLLV